MKRMFDPVSKTNDPNAGSLGISPAEQMRTALDWNPRLNPGGGCDFGWNETKAEG